ncbi:integral membrane protein [Naviculisporaceae sp. PSN 640]
MTRFGLERIETNDPHDSGPAILGATWAFTICCILIVGLRFYLRYKLHAGPVASDWVMLLALLLQIASQGCITESYQWGLGGHDEYLIPMTFLYGSDTNRIPWVQMLKWVYLSTIPGVLSSIVARISVAMLLITIFGTKRWLKMFLIVFTSLVAVLGSLSVIFSVLQAKPIEGLWNPFIPAERWDPRVPQYMVYAGGSVYAFTDLTFVLFPVLIIWKLNLPLHRRLGLCVLMAGSLFSMGACIMRIVISHDLTLHQSAVGMLWALLEQCLVIALGSAPILASIRRLDIVKSWSASLASLVDRSPLVSLRGTRGGSSKRGGNSKEASNGAGSRKRVFFPKKSNKSKTYDHLGTPASAGSDNGEKWPGRRSDGKFLNTVTVHSTFNMSRLDRGDAHSFTSDSDNGLVDRREVVPSYPPPVAGSRRITVTAERGGVGRMV